MRVRFLDLEKQHAPLQSELEAAACRVLRSQRFILGPEVETFEREVASAIGVKHAVGVSSGTDALLVALMALGVGTGDEVITTPLSFFATAGVIARLGATPVFADIDPETFNLDPSEVSSRVTSRTKVVIAVHLFGRPCDIKGIREAAPNVPVVEDAAQAIGATTNDGPVGGLGALGCFSFFPSKNLGGFGDAGLVTTEDDGLAKRVRTLRVHGAQPKYFHSLVGGNFRLDALQAALLRVKLPHLKGWTSARRTHFAYYDDAFRKAGLGPEQLLLPDVSCSDQVCHQYVVRTSQRDQLADFLREREIDTAIYYPKPLHLQECFAELGHWEGEFPHAERAAREGLALPVHPALAPEQRNYVVQSVKRFFGGAR